MAVKPTIADARWDTDLVNNTAPTSGRRDTGFPADTIPTSDELNVLFVEAYRWALYLSDGVLEGDHSIDGQLSTTALATLAAMTCQSSARLQATVRMESAISPSTISTTQHNFNPTGMADAFAIRVTMASSVDFTGLVGGAQGRLIHFVKVSGDTATLSNEDAGSDAANRFALPAGLDIDLVNNGEGVLLWYDGTSSRWRVLSKNF